MQHDSVHARIAALTDAQVAAAHEMLAGRIDTPQTLVAYVVAESGAHPDPEALRTKLLERLPLSSVPSRVVVLEHVPRGANGKEDREQLRRLCRAAPVAAREPATDPGSDLEALVGIVWSRQLDAPAIAAPVDFFRAGGTSIGAIRTLTALNTELGTEIPLVTMFRFPRSDLFAAAVTERAGEDVDLQARARRAVARLTTTGD